MNLGVSLKEVCLGLCLTALGIAIYAIIFEFTTRRLVKLNSHTDWHFEMYKERSRLQDIEIAALDAYITGDSEDAAIKERATARQNNRKTPNP